MRLKTHGDQAKEEEYGETLNSRLLKRVEIGRRRLMCNLRLIFRIGVVALLAGVPAVSPGDDSSLGQDSVRDADVRIKLADADRIPVGLVVEDFESWAPTGLWEVLQAAPAWWDDWTCFHTNGTRSLGCAAGGPEQIACGETYPDDMHTLAIWGPFDLTGASNAEVVFDYEINVEDRWDNFYWKAGVSDSGPFYGYSHYEWMGEDQNHWYGTRHFDLTSVPTLGNLCGQPEVYIVFEFESDDSIEEGEGVSIDDLRLSGDFVPVEASSWGEIKALYR